MRTIAVANQKGGCGKTITAINLSAFLARAQRRVLLVDMDPQGHSTLGLDVDSAEATKTMYDVLLREPSKEQAAIRDIILPAQENLDVAPADILLSGVPQRLAAVFGRENRLSEAIEDVRGHYEYVIVDCPPNVGVLTFNALKACSEAIIPVDPSFFSLNGIAKMLETLKLLEDKAGHRVDARALITQYTGRVQFVKDVADEIRHHLADRTFDTVIRYSVKLAEAASHGLPITHYAKRSAGFADYQALAEEVMQREEAMMARSAGEAADRKETPGALERAEGVEEEGDLPISDPLDLPEPAPPQLTPEGVVFTLEAPAASRVQLAGDFTEWVADGNEMERIGHVWRKVMPLDPGRYRYRFVVDGRWRSDPLNPEAELSPYGDSNSVLVLDHITAAQ